MTGFLSRFFFEECMTIWGNCENLDDCVLIAFCTNCQCHRSSNSTLLLAHTWSVWSHWRHGQCDDRCDLHYSICMSAQTHGHEFCELLKIVEKKIRKLISFCVLNIVFSIEQHDSMWLRAKKNFNCVNLNAEKKTPAQLKLTHPENSVRIAHEIMKHEKTQLKLRQKGNRQSGRWLTAETNFTHSERTHRMEKNFSLLVSAWSSSSPSSALSHRLQVNLILGTFLCSADSTLLL